MPGRQDGSQKPWLSSGQLFRVSLLCKKISRSQGERAEVELKVITKPEGLQAIQEGWLELLTHPGNSGIHQSFDWFWAGYQAFHLDDQLYVLVLKGDNGSVIGVAPLVITYRKYRGVRVRRIGFARNEQSPANDFILSPGLEDNCLDLILDHLCLFLHWEFIDLQKLNADKPIGRYLQNSLGDGNYRFGIQPNIQSPYISIDKTWEDFWNSRSKKFKKAMRNKLNRAQKSQDLVIEKIPVTSGKTPELEDILSISSNSWKRQIGTDLATREDNWEFYKQISNLYGPKGFPFIWLLRIGRVGAAFEFHLEYNGVIYPIRADYDETYKDISPGSILEYEIIKRHFCEKRFAEYNSCGATYEYLLNWADELRSYHNVEIFARNPKMNLLFALEYKVLRWMRRTAFYRGYKFIKQKQSLAGKSTHFGKSNAPLPEQKAVKS